MGRELSECLTLVSLRVFTLRRTSDLRITKELSSQLSGQHLRASVMEFILSKVIWYMIYIYTHVAIYHNIHKLLSRTYIAYMDVKVHTIV